MRKFLVTFLISIILCGTFLPVTSLAAITAPKGLETQYGQFVKQYGRAPNTPAEFSQFLNNQNQSQTTGTASNFFNNTIPGAVIAAPVKSIGSAVGAVGSAVKGTLAAVNCLTSPVQCGQLMFVSFIQWIGNIILSLVSWVLWLSGIIFNLSIIVFVVNMKGVLDQITIVFTVWKTVRDLANMFFIFILLYIAIQTILQLGGNWKVALRNIVLVALFINFSFFATGLMIDASNIIALQFYQGMASSDCAPKANAGLVELADGCMSWKIVQSLGLTTLYQQTQYNTSTNAALAGGADALTFIASPGIGQLSGIAKLVVAVIAGSILMLIVSIIFIVSSILIFYRFVELIFLLMFSPLAFAAIILPSTKKYFSEWWEKLMAQLIFAPVYFMFLWVVIAIITSGVLKTTLHASDASFVNLFDISNIQGMFGMIANYIIIIILMWYSIHLAKKLGASGSKQTIKAAGSIAGFVGRNTAGRLAARVANSDAMKNYRKENPTMGRLVQAPFNAAAGYGFLGKKGGYTKAQKDFVKGEEDFAKTLGPDPVVLRNAELRLDRAKEAEKAVVAPFETQENEVKTNIEETEQKLAAAKREEARILSTSGDIAEGGAATQAVNSAETELERLKAQRASIINNKKAAADRATNSEIGQEKKAAQAELEKLKGVTEEEAKRRAKKIIEDRAEAGEYGTDKKKIEETMKVEIKKMTQEIIDSNKGIAKTNQEAFAKAAEKGVGATVAKIIPTQKGKTFVKNFIDIVITDRHARIAAGGNLRKLAKGKSKKDELYETFTKVAKEESEEEGTPKEPKAEEGEAGGGAPKTT